MGAVGCQETRKDGLCGPGNKAPSGRDAQCEHIPPFPTCCQRNGHCGWDCDDVPPPPPPPAAPSRPSRPSRPSGPLVLDSPAPASVSSSGGIRDDGRCGSEFPLDDGTPAGCDPNSAYFCCSEHGYCGGTGEHCSCETCINYRPAGGVRSSLTVSGRVRSDRRCGPEFPLSDGQPSECDGATENHCCSNWGYCGPGSEHCDCADCVDYRTADQRIRDWVGLWRKDRRAALSSLSLTAPDLLSATQTVRNSAAASGD